MKNYETDDNFLVLNKSLKQFLLYFVVGQKGGELVFAELKLQDMKEGKQHIL